MTTPKSAEPGLTDEENEELWRANKWDRTVFGRAAYARGLAAGRETDVATLKRFKDSLRWSAEATEDEKTLVIGNLNGAIATIEGGEK